jgi:hypothetical protein
MIAFSTAFHEILPRLRRFPAVPSASGTRFFWALSRVTLALGFSASLRLRGATDFLRVSQWLRVSVVGFLVFGFWFLAVASAAPTAISFLFHNAKQSIDKQTRISSYTGANGYARAT